MLNLSNVRSLTPSTRLVLSARSASQQVLKKSVPSNVKVFDRETKRRQRNWAASQPDFNVAQYVKDEVGYRVADKVFDLVKFNEVVLDLGCGAGHISPNLIKENVGCVIQCDMSENMVKISKSASETEFPTMRIVADEELVPFRKESIDLIVSSLAAHWINDLPGWFSRCLRVLRPDGAMIGAVLAGDTLYQLRVALQLAENERLGGMGVHISPFIEAQDIGSLMTRAGFDMITLDSDEIEVGYPNMFALLYDLQLMAESNSTIKRSANLRRDVLIAADAIYKQMYGAEGQYPATFQFISFIGWKPGPLMPKPAKRGSQDVSLKDLGQVIQDPEKFIKKK
uniref:Methyltransferase type 11 domain-containing protein n=1 Tax=Panagrolaimus sp. JU765 TaxID=591449 RepID=A0AC34PWE5_9BILA